MRRLIAGLLLALALPAQGQGFDLKALMQLMAEVPASRTRFVEVREVALLTRPLELKGELAYERPHRLSKHVTSPFDERISVDGDALSVARKGETRRLSLREQPALGALVESVRATLAGDQAQLERHYRLQFSGARNGWKLALTPREARLRAFVETISISGAAARVARVEVLEGNGDRSVMTILRDGS